MGERKTSGGGGGGASGSASASGSEAPVMRRRTSLAVDNAENNGGHDEPAWDWENASTPLKPKGKKPKFVKPVDKHNANEGETAYIFFTVEGNPVPEVQWYKGFKDLNMEPRYRTWTDSSSGVNQVILGVRECRQDEEGEYKCVLKTKEHGDVDFDFKLFVTVEGGMDFRAMLLKRKIKQKKVVVKQIEWLEKPVDVMVQERKDAKAVFTARLSEKEKKGKWFFRNNDSHKDIRAGEHGLELHKDDGSKYDMSLKGDVYTLTIHNPTVADAARYTLVVRIDKDSYFCSGYLEVRDADPEYYFARRFKETVNGFTKRATKIVCALNVEGAKVKWYKDGKLISFADRRIERREEGEKLTLVLHKCRLEDSGKYSCKIENYVKEGEDAQIDCNVVIEPYPHKFKSKLKGKSVVEHQEAAFEIEVEADDADVTWFQNGQEIKPDGKRVVIAADGHKRKLVIKDTLLSDAGEITCKTNTDQASCKLSVAHANRFLTDLPSTSNVVEREAATFTVQVKDPNAPVDFYIAGQKVEPGDGRCEVKKLDNGKHQLVIHNIKTGDEGTIEARTPSNYGDEMVSSTCSFNVSKGEEAPQLSSVPRVNGVAHKECNWQVPYKVEGVQQSPLEMIVVKDGKELRIGQDVSVNLQGDAISLSVINPRREKSGTYKVILRNAQGQDETDIEVNIMDKPDPPQSCTVSDVFYDNCVVHWTPPLDDGGTEIRNYVVEAIDVSQIGSKWSQVARTNTGSERQIKVEGLRNKHKYRFRTRAVNKIGTSEPCEMLGDDILIKDPWDEPTKPGTPKVEDWGPNHCDLSWKMPESDGGAPITHYEIEFMEKNMGIWQSGKTIPVDKLKIGADGTVKGTIDGLTEGCEYQFRIKAINKGGPSQPSDPSEWMIAKTRYMKPFLKQPGMYDIEVKRGRTFRYDVWFGGEPAPTATWERRGVAVEPDERTTVELFSKKAVYCERNAVLTVTRADRAADAGPYTIRLVCEGGVSEATGYVNVLDVPGKPRSLAATEVRAEHITLGWAPPEDDGGSPITGYQIRMMDVESGGGEFITVAETSGPGNLSSKIGGLRPGHLYQFEVYAINKEGLSIPIRTRDPIKAENPYKPPTAPREVEIQDFDNRSVTLHWLPPSDDGGRPITHYVVQKKDKFGGWFDALVTDDKNCTATIDELEARVPGLSEGKWYQFRVIAVNKAGDSPPSLETKPHLCRHKNLSPSIDKGQAGSKTVKTNRACVWHIRVRGEPPPVFTWLKDGAPVRGREGEDFSCERNVFQGGAIAILHIFKTQMDDAGTYTLRAENRNGKDSIDLDLIVLDPMHDSDCAMLKNLNMECACSLGFRQSELSAQQILVVDHGADQLPATPIPAEII